MPDLNRRRCFFETFYVMLELCKSGAAGKTQIMYQANLNYQQLSKYLTLLRRYGLLEEDHGKFRTTGKGSLFIDKFEELLILMDEKKASAEGLTV